MLRVSLPAGDRRGRRREIEVFRSDTVSVLSGDGTDTASCMQQSRQRII